MVDKRKNNKRPEKYPANGPKIHRVRGRLSDPALEVFNAMGGWDYFETEALRLKCPGEDRI